MNAQQIISPRIKPVSPATSSKEALTLMYKYSVDQLPVVDNGKYIGLVSCTEILAVNDDLKLIGTYEFTSETAYVDPSLHIFEVIKLVLELEITLLPVVIDHNEYIGSISLLSIVKNIAEITSIKDPGGIITITMPIRDYSLTEIARIVEVNEARILTSYVKTFPDQSTLELTLKVDKPDLAPIIKTLERYEYKIKETVQESVYFEDLKERFESLMKYLDI